ncbi:hypothetical protein HDV00_000425 [Rhizophlyctis rosea]|nr:hypothetical protein HDV00_000425 [Rhizophlyctis rosea]
MVTLHPNGGAGEDGVKSPRPLSATPSQLLDRASAGECSGKLFRMFCVAVQAYLKHDGIHSHKIIIKIDNNVLHIQTRETSAGGSVSRDNSLSPPSSPLVRRSGVRRRTTPNSDKSSADGLSNDSGTEVLPNPSLALPSGQYPRFSSPPADSGRPFFTSIQPNAISPPPHFVVTPQFGPVTCVISPPQSTIVASVPSSKSPTPIGGGVVVPVRQASKLPVPGLAQWMPDSTISLQSMSLERQETVGPRRSLFRKSHDITRSPTVTPAQASPVAETLQALPEAVVDSHVDPIGGTSVESGKGKGVELSVSPGFAGPPSGAVGAMQSTALAVLAGVSGVVPSTRPANSAVVVPFQENQLPFVPVAAPQPTSPVPILVPSTSFANSTIVSPPPNLVRAALSPPTSPVPIILSHIDPIILTPPASSSRPAGSGSDSKFTASVRSLLQKINPPSGGMSRGNHSAVDVSLSGHPIVMPPRTLSRHPSAIPGRYPLAALATLPRNGPQPSPLVIPAPTRPQIIINPRKSSLAASRRATYHRRRFTYLPDESMEVPLSPTSDGITSSEGEMVGSPMADAQEVDMSASGQGTVDPHEQENLTHHTDDDTDTNWNDTLSPITSPTSTRGEELPIVPRDPISLTTCPLCSDICEKAMRLSCCSAVCCSSCIWRWLVHSRSCPFCRTRIGPGDISAAPDVQRVADGLIVKCKAGCGWKGPRREVLEHLKGCEGWLARTGGTVKERSDGQDRPSDDPTKKDEEPAAAPAIVFPPRLSTRRIIIPLRSAHPRILFRRPSNRSMSSSSSATNIPAPSDASRRRSVAIPSRTTSAEAPTIDLQTPPPSNLPPTPQNPPTTHLAPPPHSHHMPNHLHTTVVYDPTISASRVLVRARIPTRTISSIYRFPPAASAGAPMPLLGYRSETSSASHTPFRTVYIPSARRMSVFRSGGGGEVGVGVPRPQAAGERDVRKISMWVEEVAKAREAKVESVGGGGGEGERGGNDDDQWFSEEERSPKKEEMSGRGVDGENGGDGNGDGDEGGIGAVS